MEPESLVSVPLIVGDRVVAALNVYRIGTRQAVRRGRGRPGGALRDDGRARVRLRAPARNAARAGAHGWADRAAQPPRLPRALGDEIARAGPRRTAAQRRRPRPRPLQGVNDAYGHAEGDKVLVAAAETLRGRCARATSSPASGGEEFALILPGVDGARAAELPSAPAPRSPTIAVGGRAAVLLGRRRVVPRRRARGRPPARDRRRRAVLGQALGPRPVRALRPPPRRRALARRAARGGRGPARPRGLDRPRLPARAGARHRPRRRLRGARPLPHGPFAPARPVVRPGAPVRPRGRRWRRRPSAPRCARRPAGATFLAVNVSPGALLAGGARRAAGRPPGIVIELTEHELFSTDQALDRRARRPCARAARGSRSTTPARLRRAAADHPRRAPTSSSSTARWWTASTTTRTARAARGADLVRLHDRRRGVRRGRRDARRPRGARRHGRHLRAGLGARRAGRAVGAARRRRPPPPRPRRCGSACASRASTADARAHPRRPDRQARARGLRTTTSATWRR